MVKFIAAIILSAFFLSCSNIEKANVASEKQKIMRLHNLQREYHFGKNAEGFVSQFSENFVSINKGVITKPTYQESLSRFKGYFNSVDFTKWYDITPPVIRISEDGTMAYEVVNKEVVTSYKNEDNLTIKNTTIFSWLTIYKKYGDMWKIDCIASTNK